MAENNEKLVPNAASVLDRWKYEVAQEVGVDLKRGYNGDITARDAGKVGGNMVRRMIQFAEQHLAGK
jgi:hypothetical protein